MPRKSKTQKREAKGQRNSSAVLFVSRISAGFPSPADDYMEGNLDLNAYLVRNPSATFFVKVEGQSMTGAGIFPNDLLVVDRSIEAKSGNIVIAVLNGEFVVKRLCMRNGNAELRAENPAFGPVVPADGCEVEIWGVVKYVLHGV